MARSVTHALAMQAGPDEAIAFQNALVEFVAAEADVAAAHAVARDLIVAMIVTG